ncbi:Uncharacterised protein [uncultured Eubacterium sp.]|nr:Uncharacterised protein [uncultured Eubacterium sp.]
MPIFRTKRKNSYTMVDNRLSRDTSLSLKAKGLMLNVLSLPDTWKFSVSGLVSICKENKTAVKSALKELQENGYLKINKIPPTKESNGKFSYEYCFYEIPIKEYENKKVENLDTEFLGVENLALEKLDLENMSLLNTNILNTDISNTKGINNNAPFKNGDQKCTTSKEDGGRYSPFQEKEVHYSNNSNGRTDYTNVELHDYLVQNVYNNMQPDGYYQTTPDNETVFLPADFDRRGILLDIVEYFYAKYNSIHDMKHPILSYGAFARIIDNYLMPPKIMQDNEVYGFETYRQMIDVYFSIEFGKSGNSEYGTVKPINKYISHFMSNGIRENIYRRLIDKQI